MPILNPELELVSKIWYNNLLWFAKPALNVGGNFRSRPVRNKLVILLAIAMVAHIGQITLANRIPDRSAPRTTGQPGWVPGEILVKFKDQTPPDRIADINRSRGASVLYKSKRAGFMKLKCPPGKTETELLDAYRGRPEVRYAQLNYYTYAFAIPNDPLYSYQWHFQSPAKHGINAERVWDITAGSADVIVAVLDTGVAYEVVKQFQQAPDLAEALFVPGYDFIGNDTHPNDEDGHGTHVTGTIAQSTNNNLGVAGIAYNCSIMPVKVLNRRGSGNAAGLADGIMFAADNGARVLNMSLGFPPNLSGNDLPVVEAAVQYAYAKGCVLVAAAGNNAVNTVSLPAAYPEVIAVGATNSAGLRSDYSQYGPEVELAAPGGDSVDRNGDGFIDGILQQTFGIRVKNDWGYWLFTGTSMAAPHVSATAALLISTGVDSPESIREALQNTARDAGPTGWDPEYGHGIIDAWAAINYFHNPADINYDGQIDFTDLMIMSDNWLTNHPPADIAPPGGDGIVNFHDFALMAGSWR